MKQEEKDKELCCEGCYYSEEGGLFEPTNWCCCEDCIIKGRYQWCDEEVEDSENTGCPYGIRKPTN